MRSASIVLVVSLLGFGLVLSGCGGGGGGGGGVPGVVAGPGLFSGEYNVVALGAARSGAIAALSQWGLVTGSGAGGATGLLRYNVSETVAGPAGLVPGTTYTVDAGRAFALLPGGVPQQSGGITADGRVAAIAADQALSVPLITVFAKRQGTFSAASLTGAYHMCALFVESGADRNRALFGTMTFDSGAGTGAGIATITMNEDGGITTGTSIGGGYTVAADGTMTLAFGPDFVEGGILAGGELAILAGSTTTGNPNVLVFLVKHSTAASLATVGGSYFLVGLERDGGLDYDALRGTVVSDGAGNVTTAFTRNDSGTIVADPPGAATYTVAANGLLTVVAGDTMVGGISPSGNFAILGGGSNAGANPQIIFMHR